MVRELDNRIQALQQSDDTGGQSVMAGMDTLGALDDGLILEDFRFQASRGEMLFTIKQSSVSGTDAFTKFEQLKRQLEQAGYSVEYSASQDRDAVRGRYRATREALS
jgi:type II secretory pathway component PulL